MRRPPEAKLVFICAMKGKQKKTSNIREAPSAPLPLNPIEFALMLERSMTPLAFSPTYRSMCLDLPVIIVLGPEADKTCTAMREKR